MKPALLGVLAIALVAQAGNAAPGPGPFENMGQVVLAIMTVAGAAVNALVTLGRDKLAAQREERQRQWLVEDRQHNEKLADRIREEVLLQQGRVEKKLDENTDISRGAAAAAKDAYTAANHVNEKIAAVGAMRRATAPPKRRAEDEEPQASG